MNGQTDVRAVVLIIVGVVAGCLAYRAPELGVALMAGVGAVGVLHVLPGN